MDKKLNEQLGKYSKNIIEFDLSNIERDVKLRIISEQNTYQKLIKNIEKLFGMPITLSGGGFCFIFGSRNTYRNWGDI